MGPFVILLGICSGVIGTPYTNDRAVSGEDIQNSASSSYGLAPTYDDYLGAGTTDSQEDGNKSPTALLPNGRIQTWQNPNSELIPPGDLNENRLAPQDDLGNEDSQLEVSTTDSRCSTHLKPRGKLGTRQQWDGSCTADYHNEEKQCDGQKLMVCCGEPGQQNLKQRDSPKESRTKKGCRNSKCFFSA